MKKEREEKKTRHTNEIEAHSENNNPKNRAENDYSIFEYNEYAQPAIYNLDIEYKFI